MKKWIEAIGLTGLQATVTILLGLIAGLSAVVWKEISAPLLETVLPKISNGTLLSTILLLFLVCIILLSWNIILRKELNKKPKLKNYEYIKDPGYYRDKKNNLFVCNRCLNEKQLVIPLSVYLGDAWMCRSCNEKYIPKESYAATFHTVAEDGG